MARNVCDVLAMAFSAEGVTDQFTLMGDGNMHWVARLADDFGVRTIHARHEHCAVSMAMGYARATDRVGVASVTMGPGFTQITTALTAAARCSVPLVVFAGDAPTGSRWYHQRFDQSPVIAATGAYGITIRNASHALDCVREAFYIASLSRCPVVLTVPLDIQRMLVQHAVDYVPSSHLMAPDYPIEPAVHDIDRLARAITEARSPVFLAGRGAIDAANAIRALATDSGGVLATTLLARGLFDDDPYCAGVVGGFSREGTRQILAESDLVVAFGAALGFYTTDGDTLFPSAKIASVNILPKGINQPWINADLRIRGDARLTAQKVREKLRPIGHGRGIRNERTREILQKLVDDKAFDIEPDTVDPREAIRELDGVLPKTCAIVGGSGHSFYFSANFVRERSPKDFVSLKDFGEIGSHLSYAIGVAVARPDDLTVAIDGDGSMMMNIQELDTIARHKLKMLVIALNDGAFGAERHKLAAEGEVFHHSVFGRPDFAGIAAGFGLEGRTVTAIEHIAPFYDDFSSSAKGAFWDIHISSNVIGYDYRRKHPTLA